MTTVEHFWVNDGCMYCHAIHSGLRLQNHMARQMQTAVSSSRIKQRISNAQEWIRNKGDVYNFAASAMNCFKIQTSLYSISTVECKIISKFLKLPAFMPEVAKYFHNHNVTNMPRVKKSRHKSCTWVELFGTPPICQNLISYVGFVWVFGSSWRKLWGWFRQPSECPVCYLLLIN